MNTGQLSERRQQAVEDFQKFGDYQEGEYRGVKWHAQRCYDTTPKIPREKRSPATGNIFHWCGYVTMGNEEIEEKYEDCMLAAGRECTYNENGVIGFDCCHARDYPVDASSTGVYRDFPYVLTVIQKTIDNIKNL